MIDVSQTRRTPYPASLLQEVVADVAAYPEFIPYLASMRVRDEAVEGAVRTLVAEATIEYSVFRERFATRVLEDRSAGTVRASLVSGPLKALETTWRFRALEDGGSQVDCHVRFAFKNFVLNRLAQANADRIASRMVTAFEGRAARLHTMRSGAA